MPKPLLLSLFAYFATKIPSASREKMFKTPRISFGGDSYIVLEYSIDFELEANFKVNLITELLRENNISGVVEVIPSIVGLMVHYDPLQISPKNLIDEIIRLNEEVEKSATSTVKSRFIELPILFNDKWSLECQQKFKDYHNTGDVPNIKFIAKENGISVKEVTGRIIQPQWWIVFIGFTPGLSWSAPVGIKKEEMLQVSKYKKPRLWTPVGTVSIGGVYIAIYSVTHPGGYQLFGRTPVPVVVYDERCNPEKTLEIFKKNPCLNVTSDRLKWKPITSEEYLKIEELVKEGKYQYSIKEQSFDITEYFARPVEYIQELEEKVDYKQNLKDQIEFVYSQFEGDLLR